MLADGGRMVALVPNRRGLWCLSDRTPFGHGQPYSRGQLERTLNGHLFTPAPSARPCSCPDPVAAAVAAGHPGRAPGPTFARQFAGVVLIEAEKQIYVGTPATAPAFARVGVRRYVPVMDGLAAAQRSAAEATGAAETGSHGGGGGKRTYGKSPAGSGVASMARISNAPSAAAASRRARRPGAPGTGVVQAIRPWAGSASSSPTIRTCARCRPPPRR